MHSMQFPGMCLHDLTLHRQASISQGWYLGDGRVGNSKSTPVQAAALMKEIAARQTMGARGWDCLWSVVTAPDYV